ncbi:MAG: DUF4339 domain-containing protein [Planctomycetaceae bacterium]|nr:DUF4339 domain-containing protein [Planctomycetaceae bacterium]
MAKWYYYNEKGNKVGPFPIEGLKQLAQAGTITRDTILENTAGCLIVAEMFKDLSFPKSPKLSTPPPRTASSPLHPPTPPIPATPLVDYYYVDEFGQKRGPVCIEQLQLQAELGFINETTPLETETGRIVVAGTIPDLKFNFAAYAVNAPATSYKPSRPKRTFFAVLFDFLYRSRFTDSPIYKIVYFFVCVALIIVGISLTIELAKWILFPKLQNPIPIVEWFWPPRIDPPPIDPRGTTPIPEKKPVPVFDTTTPQQPPERVEVTDGRKAGERMTLITIEGVGYVSP